MKWWWRRADKDGVKHVTVDLTFRDSSAEEQRAEIARIAAEAAHVEAVARYEALAARVAAIEESQSRNGAHDTA